MPHVHGSAFRVIGDAFSALPTVEQIVLSGYSQRPNRGTGHVENEYLYSVNVSRSAWAQFRFDNLAAIDVIENLTQFELLREMSKTGVFKAIEPFKAEWQSEPC